MGNPVAEKKTFAEFLKAAPELASDLMDWYQPEQDPPDILALMKNGRQVGVELTEWLDQEQISRAKSTESIQQAILKAIQPEPPNDTEHVHLAWLCPLEKPRIKPADAAMFREELLNLIKYIDSRWEDEPSWHSPQGCWWQDFGCYPILTKYLRLIKFFPRTAFPDSTKGRLNWLTFSLRGGAYSPHWMVEALRIRLVGKIQKYSSRPGSLDEFYLLVHYDQAWAYNTPVETPWFSFKDAARAGAESIGRNPGAFDRIYLFIPHNDSQMVFRLYP